MKKKRLPNRLISVITCKMGVLFRATWSTIEECKHTRTCKCVSRSTPLQSRCSWTRHGLAFKSRRRCSKTLDKWSCWALMKENGFWSATTIRERCRKPQTIWHSWKVSRLLSSGTVPNLLFSSTKTCTCALLWSLTMVLTKCSPLPMSNNLTVYYKNWTITAQMIPRRNTTRYRQHNSCRSSNLFSKRDQESWSLVSHLACIGALIVTS